MNQKLPEQDVDFLVASVLSGMPEQNLMELNFPSGGTLYRREDKNAPITISPITWEDEKELATSKEENRLELLLRRCIKNMNADELLAADRLYALMCLRSVSVSPTYEFNITCNNCGHIGSTDLDILNDFPKREPEVPLTEPFHVDLDGIPGGAVVSFCRAKQQESYGDKLWDNLYRFVKSIGGQENRKVIFEVLKKLPRKQFNRLMEVILQTKIGIDPRFLYTCPKCQHKELRDLPIGSDFLSENS